jgi:myo-inositol-1(or 4)-monophosphatase
MERKGEIDFVTESDRQSEKLLVRGIRKVFPSDFVWAEESGGAHDGLGAGWDGGFGWVVDPLDGTTNYVHDLPHIAVSIGLTYDGEPIGGVIVDPIRAETFVGIAGEGAFLNDVPIEVTRTLELSQALIATGFPYDRREHINALLDRVGRALEESHGIRRNGVAALDLCWLACGRFDAFFEEGLQPWDVCAGAVIVREAGGSLSDYRGGPFDLLKPEIVATNGRIHGALLDRVVQTATGRATCLPPGESHS